MPTVGDAVEALNDLCVDLADTLKQIADLSAELASRDHVRIDNIEEVRRNFKSCGHFTHHNFFRSSVCQTSDTCKNSMWVKNGP